MNPDKYIVRVVLFRLPFGERPTPLIQNSSEYESEKEATELFKDLLRQMPQPEVTK